MSSSSRKSGKQKKKRSRYYGFSALLFVLGTLFPPLAVAARFGVGRDFWLNLLLTVCGYFPGHFHNFYIQNIRNNKNRARTPKWASRYGLVDTSAIERKKKKSEWAKRYGERLPNSALEGQEYEEGQIADPASERGDSPGPQHPGQDLWRQDEERYYGTSGGHHDPAESSSTLQSENSGGRWTYPANFNDAVIESGSRRKKKSSKKDRWERTEEAYAAPDDSERRRKKKKKKAKPDDEIPSDIYTGNSIDDEQSPAQPNQPARDEFDHQF